jgi:hypothetical protein
MTYLEIVNKVLRRLREQEVGSVSDTAYSRLIGDLVNEVKTKVENAWNWNALRYTFVVNTVPTLFNYELVDALQNSKAQGAWNDTGKFEMRPMTTKEAELRFLTSRTPSQPFCYNFNGVSDDGWLQVDVWPIPDQVYVLTFNMIVPQAELSLDGDILKVPYQPVIEGAVARAIEERGEDGGTASSKADARYLGAVADAIAIDSSFHPDEITWNPE